MDTITKILNCFEQGKPEFQHHKVDILKDQTFPGSSQRVQGFTLSYGITEAGMMHDFIADYIALKGKYAEEFKPFLSKIGKTPLVSNSTFKALLKKAPDDKVYTDLLETYFEERYLKKAFDWCDKNGFHLPLSRACIADSFLHSGSMLDFLRRRFPEVPPAQGGDEKTYIKQYMTVRRDWLKNHSDSTLKKLWTRPQFYLNQITDNNWNLTKFPIFPNGVKITS